MNFQALISFFKKGKKPDATASVAKERLQIIIAREHVDSSKSDPEFLPKLREDLLAVLAKYVKVDQEAIKVSIDRKENLEVLDVNVVISA